MNFLGIFLRFILSFRYRVTTKGLDSLNVKGPTLFLPNHPALIDPLIVYSLLAHYNPRPLIDEQQLQGLHGRLVAKMLNAVGVPDIHKSGFRVADAIRQSIHEVLETLKQGENVLLYPAGQIYRAPYEKIGGKSAAFTLVQQIPNVNIVLVRTSGLWGSSFSYGYLGKEPNLIRVFLRGITTVLGNLIFFTPKRDVFIEFIQTDQLKQFIEKKTFNLFLENFYNENKQERIEISRWFWKK